MHCAKCTRPVRGSYWVWASLQDRWAAFYTAAVRKHHSGGKPQDIRMRITGRPKRLTKPPVAEAGYC
jgi:hypothetical protein